MPDCYRKGYEKGLWFEIKCVQDTIKMKEANGEDCKFEKSLLRAWKKYDPVKYDKALEAISLGVAHQQGGG